MNAIRLKLSLLEGTFAVCKLASDAPIPSWALSGNFFSLTRTPDELSIVCPQASAAGACEDGWRCLRVAGPLDFALTGILASLTRPLAEAGISVFAISTYDTDYLLIKEQVLQDALQVLSRAGHQIDA